MECSSFNKNSKLYYKCLYLFLPFNSCYKNKRKLTIPCGQKITMKKVWSFTKDGIWRYYAYSVSRFKNSACEDICERNSSISQVKFVEEIVWGRKFANIMGNIRKMIEIQQKPNSLMFHISIYDIFIKHMMKLQHMHLVLLLTFLQNYCKCITHCTHDDCKSYSFREIQITNIWISTSPQNMTMTRKQNVHDNFQCNWKNFLYIFSFASFILKRHFIKKMELD